VANLPSFEWSWRPDPDLVEKITGSPTFLQTVEGIGGALKSILNVAGVGIDVMLYFGFTEFILEETIQTVMFGIWPLMDAGEYEAAWRQTELMERMVKALEDFTAGWGRINLFGNWAYNLYAKAARSYIEATRRAIRKKLLFRGYKSALEEAKKALLILESAPERAKIYLDGKYIRKLTPEDLLLDPGKHKIILVKRGYKPMYVEVEVEAGKRYHLQAFFDEKTYHLEELPTLELVTLEEIEEKSVPEGWKLPEEVKRRMTGGLPEIEVPEEARRFIEEIGKEAPRPAKEEEKPRERRPSPPKPLPGLSERAIWLTKQMVPKDWTVITVEIKEKIRPKVYRWIATLHTPEGKVVRRDYIGVLEK